MDRSEWVLVPRKLSAEQLQAMSDCYDATWGYSNDSGVEETWAHNSFEAMLAAAPPPPAEQASGEDMHVDLPTPDLLAEAERIAANQYKDGRYAAARVLRILCHRLSQRPVVSDEMVELFAARFFGPGGLYNRNEVREAMTSALAPQQPEKGEG